MAGPLTGVRVVEFEGIGPAPYCGMLLADLGADVVRVARPKVDRGPLIQHKGDEPIDRGRTLVTLDLKSPEGVQGALDLCARADAVIEGLRPGVMERLGLGPDVMLAQNPKLVFCRIAGSTSNRNSANHTWCAPTVDGTMIQCTAKPCS